MKIAVLALLLCSALAWGQNADQGNQSGAAEKKRTTLSESLPQSAEHKGAWDIGIWGGGGHSVSGGTSGVTVGNAGVRLGKILTDQHGSGWYKGNFEYAVDLIPVYVIAGLPGRIIVPPCPLNPPTCLLVPFKFDPGGNAYGGGFNPLVAKWNFTNTRKISPYFELNGGVLFTNREVPVATSDVNFMSGAVLGMNVFTSTRHALSFDVKYVHISNAGLATLNPGINTVQGTIGFHWFK